MTAPISFRNRAGQGNKTMKNRFFWPGLWPGLWPDRRAVRCAAALVAAVLMGGVQQPAWAGGTVVYDCQLKAYGSPSEQSFIPKTQRLTIDRDAGTAMVWDDIIELLTGKPVAVGVVEMGDKRINLGWTLHNVPTTGTSELHVSYEARLFVTRNRLTLRGYFHGYDNEFSGKGTCKVAK
ncbi:hypothetical protein LCL97_16000 [Seohaeicola saemankumensis]|nr:hypothetical protein [Seohaeicola saemankumensis]MCA0872339.1 hypothetical protein [Seohaeicola saemankumensis]